MLLHRVRARVLAVATLAAGLAAVPLGPAAADHTPTPTSVAIAGSLQEELGCPGDWQPECAVTDLTYEPDSDVWSGTFTVPAGDWEYKAPLNDAWDENYGLGAERDGPNIPLSLAADTDVNFYYSHDSHWITDDVNDRIVTAPGSFQAALGCPGDWQPECMRSWLQDPDGDDVYTLTTTAIPAGSYEGKAAVGRSWDENYGEGGVADGPNIAFTVAAGEAVTFSFDSATNVLTIDTGSGPGTGNYSDTIEPGDEALVTAPVRPESDESVYFVMTDRFANGDTGNDEAGEPGDRLVNGFDPTDKGWHHGGDIAGLQSQLDYIEGLGVSAIWITPPFKNDYVQGPGAEVSSSYHGYWQTDFTQIDPHYGTNAEMAAFVADAHSRGIKVLFDVVLNHTGDLIDYVEGSTPLYRNKTEYPYVDADGNEFDDRDFEGTGTFPDLDPATSFPYTPVVTEATKAPDWLNNPIYYHNRGDSTFSGENSQYGDFFGLDDLFHEHPVVVDGMIDIHTAMIDTFDIDGFRVDTVKHVSDGFWEAWVPAVLDHASAAGKDDFVMFGEVFGETHQFRSRYSTELDFPGTLDFGFNGNSYRFAANSAPTNELTAFFATDDWYTDTDSNAHDLAKFMGNHDIGRLALEVVNLNGGASDDELVARLEIAQALNWLTRGIPVVYYGDEQGFVGDGGDQDARQDMMPSEVATYNDDDLIGTDATTADDNFDPTHPLYTAIAELAAVRDAHPTLQTGAQVVRSSSGSAGIFAFSRIPVGGAGNEYVVAINNSETEQSATFTTDTASSNWTAVAPTGAAAATSDADGNLTVTVPALSWVVYQADSPLTTGASPDGLAIAMTAPADGAEVVGRAEVGADLLDGRYAEVTFAVSVDGGTYEVIGTDDAGSASNGYNVYHDVSGYPVGSTVTFKAIARDAGGNLVSNTVSAVVGEEEEPPPPGGGDAAYAIIHYQRSDGDYGDHTTGDFNDFWGLHLWGDAIDPSEVTEWTSPKPFLGEDEYGRFAWVKLAEGAAATDINFIVHRGDAKDGTEDDRSFNAAANPEIWLKQDDGATYTTQADAQGFVTIHYQRPDGIYDDWGLHLWGDAIDPAEATEWTSPKPFDGIDDYGAFWTVDVSSDDGATSEPVNFIIHRGDDKDPGPDQSMIPADGASVWIQSGDERIYESRGGAEDFATIHYHRDDGDYGDPTSVDFNDFWGLHLWVGAAEPNPSWQQPMKPTGFDLFGPYWEVPLVDGAPELAHIIHRGDTKDPGPDMFLTFSVYGYEVWQLENADPDSPYIIPVPGGGGGGGVSGNLSEQRAHWADADTIVWDPGEGAGSAQLCGAASGGMTLSDTGVDGSDTCVDLTAEGAYPGDIDGQLHLGGLPAWTVPGDADAATLLTGQLAVVALDGNGNRVNATGVQIAGVLDALYATDVELGAVWLPAALPATPPRPELRLWAPTAKSVNVHLYNGPTGDAVETVAMTPDNGVWTAAGEPDWNGMFYLYEVEVYVPSTDSVETNLVSDPYSVSLARNSVRSQIVNLADAALAPAGWADTAKPSLGSFEEASVYELHVRDFSIRDESVPVGDRGTFAAFTHGGSDGMTHLSALADAGLTHVHLLPVFDIATINEDPAERTEPDWATLESFAPDSDQQQALISPIRDDDGFNWGYDPFHYTVPEGSYSTDPQGSARITEFREMVQSLNGTGLRVVMDVVYNHTHAAGQDDQSVLDRIVPGYYHRLDEAGVVATSTCCPNTATEHAMMGKLMVDSVVTWAKHYKVDGFRFDLMGHHSKANMLAVRAALDALTEADDGVDGSKILIYGEGWNFGEVADNARFEQASQLNLGGTGIATFSDRLRDAVRGGGPFDGGDALVINQGWVNGLWYDPNAQAMPEADALDRLLLAGDQIRVGLAGNLAGYEFTDRTGATVTGSDIDYNGSPAGYTADPQENVVYIAAHDNQTLFDIGQYHHPLSTSTVDRARAQNVGNAVVALAQGLSFYHAGQDMLRSKSMDRDSYNSGDWFNRLDFTYQTNNWGAGLPVEDVNGDNWYLIQPRLADPALKPTPGDIEFNAAVTREWLQIRTSTPLFSLPTAAAVQEAVSFTNTGPDQIPGLIAMSIADTGDGVGDDAELAGVVVLFNPTTSPVEHTIAESAGSRAQLHPVLAGSVDEVVRTASFDDATGTFWVPARTAAVFVVPEPDVTPPTVTAALELVQQRGRNGVYRVGASCVDTGGVPWADGGVVAEFSAELNGVPVEDGQELFLVQRPGQQKVIENGPQVTIQAPSFELVVTCTDAWGNTTTERISP